MPELALDDHHRDTLMGHLQRKLAAAARLSGPERYLTYGELELELARDAAPLAALDNLAESDFYSARIGCQTFGIEGIDLAALCRRTRTWSLATVARRY